MFRAALTELSDFSGDLSICLLSLNETYSEYKWAFSSWHLVTWEPLSIRKIYAWMDKEGVAYINNTGILLNQKKEWNTAICNNIDEPRDYHTKLSKSERERQIPYEITYTWNLKYNTNELIYETETDSQDIENRLVGAKEVGTGRRMQWEFGISRCKLIYITWINNKVLLYSLESIFSVLWQTVI